MYVELLEGFGIRAKLEVLNINRGGQISQSEARAFLLFSGFLSVPILRFGSVKISEEKQIHTHRHEKIV